jgi:hypothetical protein
MEVCPELELNESEATRTALETEMRELLHCSESSLLGIRKGLLYGNEGGKEGSERGESERGLSEKQSVSSPFPSLPTPGNSPDKDRTSIDPKFCGEKTKGTQKIEEIIWREIVSHHIAIETLRTQERRETSASCDTIFSSLQFMSSRPHPEGIWINSLHSPTNSRSSRILLTSLADIRPLIKIYQVVRQQMLGPLYLLLEIAIQTHSSTDSVIEVMSRAISHMKIQVPFILCVELPSLRFLLAIA